MHKFVERLESRLLLNAADVDTAFGADGRTLTQFSGPGTDYAMAEAQQTDGKLVVVGLAQKLGDSLAVARYNPDGSPDSSFGAGGSESLSASVFDQGHAVAIQGDGKIVVGGLTEAPVPGGGHQYEFSAWRLNPNGSLDTSFNGTGQKPIPLGLSPGNPVSGIAVQSDGKIVLAGTTPVNSVDQMVAVRLNPNGTIDTTFGAAGEATTTLMAGALANALAIDSAGRIVLAGQASQSGSSYSHFAAARFTASGAPDATFGSGGTVTTALTLTDTAQSLAIQPDGKIVLGGACYNGSHNYMAVARYNADGTLDTTFASTGHELIGDGVHDDSALGVALTSTGGIVLAGGNGSNVLVVLLTASGSTDYSFNWSGQTLGSAGLGRAVLVRAGDSITVAASNGSKFVLNQFTVSGQPDAAFGTYGLVSSDIIVPALSYASAAALQPDGKLVAVGQASTTGTVPVIARFNADGTPDATFGTNGVVAAAWGSGSSTATFVAIQSNGGILVAGAAIDPSTNQREPLLTRYQPSGTLDTSFGSGGQVYIGAYHGSVLAGASSAYVAIQADGNIILMGNGNAGFLGLARLTPTGQFDTSYGGNGITYPQFNGSDTASAIALDSAGRLIVGCPNGPRYTLVRFTTTGAFDPTFGSNGIETIYTGADSAPAMVLTAEGKILVGGSQNNGTNDDFKLARFNSNGSLDGTFGSGGMVQTDLGAYDAIESLQVLADGSILAAGSSGNGVALADYSSAGALRSSFGQSGVAVASFGDAFALANAMVVRPNGRIVVAGEDSHSFMVAQFIGTIPDVVAGTPGNDTLQLRRDSNGQDIDWFMGSQSGQVPANDPNGLTFSGNGGNDAIVLDDSQSNPLPALLHLNGTFTLTGLQSLNGTTLDMGSSTLYVNYAGSSDPIANVRQSLVTGYDGGTWNGQATASTGSIITSAGALGFDIGYADAADNTGINPAANTIELKYTLAGDANLDGTVNLADFLGLSRNFGKLAASWDQGNFNYDGTANLSDLLQLVRNFGRSVPAATALAASFSSAPIQQPDPIERAQRRTATRRMA